MHRAAYLLLFNSCSICWSGNNEQIRLHPKKVAGIKPRISFATRGCSEKHQVNNAAT